MALSLTNSKDIVANSISIIKGNRTIDVLETIDAVTGLAPETLNSLEKLATAMDNDPAFFTALSTAIGTKANTSDTFLKSVSNNDVYLTISTNKRIVGTATANQFKFQILDNQGA
jgi:hypothetical protein